jgi:hypothetical protein
MSPRASSPAPSGSPAKSNCPASAGTPEAQYTLNCHSAALPEGHRNDHRQAAFAMGVGLLGKGARLQWGRAARARLRCLDYLAFCLVGFRVCSANMGCKFFIAQPLVLLPHFLERFAGGRPRRTERPCASRATPALKARLFNPYLCAECDHPGMPRGAWVGWSFDHSFVHAGRIGLALYRMDQRKKRWSHSSH